MSGLVEPPKEQKTSRLLVRFLVLIFLLLAAATVIWAATTRTLIGATEDETFQDLELETRQTIETTTINIVTEEGGPTPVLLLHGYDIAGSVTWDGVVRNLDENHHAIRLDLPGFGMSDRLPSQGSHHTVASMAEVVAAAIETNLEEVPVVVGVGLGGEVAAELAVVHPELVKGVVLIDVDFWEGASWQRFAERLPFVGTAVTYTLETGGRLAGSEWAPFCGEGGWCPTSEQGERRDLAASIEDSTPSLQAFIRTRPASLVPSDLDSITAPVVFLWSGMGLVPEDSVDRVGDSGITDYQLTKVDVFQVHVEDPEAVADAVLAVDR